MISDAPAPASTASAGIAAAPVLSVRVVTAMGAGALLAAAFPPYGVPVLLPIGIAALLAALRGATVREAAYTGFACGAVFFGSTLFWLGNLFGAAAISLVAIAAAFPMLFAALYAVLINALPLMPAWLIAAVTWTGIEFYRSEPFVLNFGWMGLGYGVIGSPLAARLASVAGSYGITFGIVVLGAALHATLRRRTRGGVARAGLLFAVWLGALVLPLPRASVERPVRVALIQKGGDDEVTLLALSRPQVDRRPDVIVWPEYSLMTDPRPDRRLWDKLRHVAIDNSAWFVFGAEQRSAGAGPDDYHNTAFVLDPTGAVAGVHVKNHPVHFFRDGIAGTRADPIPSKLGRLGVGICFDMDYPEVARRLVQGGACVLLVPNMDPLEWGDVQRAQHTLMFRMRAAECGRWLARADVAGGTSVVDPNGAVTARVHTSDPVRLDAVAGRTGVTTLYVRGGWRFGQACLIALAGLLAVAIVHRVRGRRRCWPAHPQGSAATSRSC